MKKVLFINVIAFTVLAEMLFGPTVKSAYAVDLKNLFDLFRYQDNEARNVTLCFRNNGLVYLVGGGFKKADCRSNDELISFYLKGIFGDKGPTGDKGQTGDTGPTGIQGPTGVVGPTGLVGQMGPVGDKGSTGDKGINGDTGATGLTGLPGPSGSQGAEGNQGPAGPQGPPGPGGENGDPGPQGATGPVGIQGPDGAQGPIGTEGPSGQPGQKGDTGAKGLDGSTGSTGVSGTNGVSGWEMISSISLDNSDDPKMQEATCSAGKKVIGGGFSTNVSGTSIYVQNSYPSGENKWSVKIHRTGSTNWILTAYAICINAL